MVPPDRPPFGIGIKARRLAETRDSYIAETLKMALSERRDSECWYLLYARGDEPPFEFRGERPTRIGMAPEEVDAGNGRVTSFLRELIPSLAFLDERMPLVEQRRGAIQEPRSPISAFEIPQVVPRRVFDDKRATKTITGSRRGSVVGEDDDLGRFDAGGGDVRAGHELRECLALALAADEEHDEARSGQHGERQRQARVVGVLDAEDETVAFLGGWVAGEERGDVAVLTEAEQHEVEGWDTGAEAGAEVALIGFRVAVFAANAVHGARLDVVEEGFGGPAVV